MDSFARGLKSAAKLIEDGTLDSLVKVRSKVVPPSECTRILQAKSNRKSNSREIPNFSLENIEKEMVPRKRTVKEVSFGWSRDQRISSTDSKVRTTLDVFIIDSGGKRVKDKTGATKTKLKTVNRQQRNKRIASY